MSLLIGTRRPLSLYLSMGTRGIIDLELRLNDPKEARKYIENFDWSPMPPPKYIIFNLNEKVLLNGPMTDQEAVAAAKIILQDVEIPSIMREKQLAPWGISVWEH